MLEKPVSSELERDKLPVAQIAPCLVGGVIASSARAFVKACDSLGTSRWAHVLRALSVPYAYAGTERAFAASADPVPAVNDFFQRLADFLESTRRHGFPGPAVPNDEGVVKESESTAIEETTGNHYGYLFRDFSASSFWDEPVQLLRTRLERNNIQLRDIQRSYVLDAGCGGGRYAYAWRVLGAKHVTAIDISDIGLDDGKRRGEQAGITGVQFQKGNVLAMPFENNAFDVVFSNGILHHTADWERGVSELVRVLKPGGLGWLYVIENPGGLFWDVIEVLRVITRAVPRHIARSTLQALGVPRNRMFYMLDHVMVPINVRLSPEEVERALVAAGARDIRRLNRGADFDRVERIFQNELWARIKYGVGENRYVFSK